MYIIIRHYIVSICRACGVRNSHIQNWVNLAPSLIFVTFVSSILEIIVISSSCNQKSPCKFNDSGGGDIGYFWNTTCRTIIKPLINSVWHMEKIHLLKSCRVFRMNNLLNILRRDYTAEYGTVQILEETVCVCLCVCVCVCITCIWMNVLAKK